MLVITIQVNARPGQAIGIKEDLALYLERYGDARVVSVEECGSEQMTLWEESGHGEKRVPRMRR